MPKTTIHRHTQGFPARVLSMLQRCIAWALPSFPLLPIRTVFPVEPPYVDAMEVGEWTKVYSPKEAAELRRAVFDKISERNQMPQTVKEWVQTHPLYVDVAGERDALLEEVAELRKALVGIAHAHRVERAVVDRELATLRERLDAGPVPRLAGLVE